MTESEVKKFLSPDELKWAEKVCASISKYIIAKTEKGNSPRMFHADMHGCTYAEFTVAPNLTDDLKVGIFGQERTFPAWIRFSNSTRKPDIKKNTRGMAIKLMGVGGEKLIEEGTTQDTQDFLVVNVPTLAAKSFKVAAGAVIALTASIPRKLWFAICNIPALLQSLKSYPCYNLLETEYYSQAPSKFGDRAVKFAVFPNRQKSSKPPENPTPDYLRVRLSTDIEAEDAYFDFMVQFQENPDTEPIEDLSVLWKTPFVKVATIRIPKQRFGSDEQRWFGQKLSYSPWHSVKELMPLSGVSRLRTYVYAKMADLRRTRNEISYNEPLPQSVVVVADLIGNDNPYYESIVASHPDANTERNPLFRRLKAMTPPALDALKKKAESLNEELLGEPYSMSQTKVYQCDFTCFTNIKSDGSHYAELKILLGQIGRDIVKNPHINFGKVSMVHFCRWFLLDEAKNMDGSLIPPQLVFNAVYDGELDVFLDAILKNWETGLDTIYQHCEGYPEAGNPKEKEAYLIEYKNKPRTAWAAKVGGTLGMIKQQAVLRNTLEALIDLKFGDKTTPPPTGKEIYGYLQDYIFNHAALHFCLYPEPGPSFLKACSNVIRAIANFGIVVPMLICPTWPAVAFLHWSAYTLFISPVIIAVALAIITELIENPHIKPPVPKPLNDVLDGEDRKFQNQLTVYGTFKSPNLFHTNLLRLGMVISSLMGRYRSTKGSLGGIQTIHFLAWHIFNNAKNAMFLSNYDGGWESYLSEFIDFGGWAMNLNFGNIKGYPKINFLFWGGAYNEQVFKTVVRNYQFPCQVWYSAYPMLSIRNVLTNAQICKGFSAKMTDKQIEEWLQLF